MHSLQLAVARDTAALATLRQSDAEAHSSLTTVQSQLQHEQALRMEDRSTIRQELTHWKEIADRQIRHACSLLVTYLLRSGDVHACSQQCRILVSRLSALWCPSHLIALVADEGRMQECKGRSHQQD